MLGKKAETERPDNDPICEPEACWALTRREKEVIIKKQIILPFTEQIVFLFRILTRPDWR